MSSQGDATTTEIKKQVKIVKKQVKTKSKSEVQNGDHNGEENVEAELTVKLPSKKSQAKTETKVEVVKKQLPDGSVEEVKTTTTTTTVDGKTTISTKTETTIIPKEEEIEEEVEEEEEEEDVNDAVQEEQEEEIIIKSDSPAEVENENKSTLITNEKHCETTTTKKVTIVQNEESDEEEHEEAVAEESEQEEVVEKNEEAVEENNEDEDDKEEVITTVDVQEATPDKVEEIVKTESISKTISKENDSEEEVGEEETVEKEETVITEEKNEDKPQTTEDAKQQEAQKGKDDEESEYTEEEYESDKEETTQVEHAAEKTTSLESKISVPQSETPEIDNEEVSPKNEEQSDNEKAQETAPAQTQAEAEPVVETKPTIPLREPSIPLEKVEEVEIKPLTPAVESIIKTHTQNTEIITTEKPSGPLSTQTEYNRVENIVTVNRTTKTLDHSYEQLTQHGVPTVKAYFAPNRERVPTSPQPSKPYEPVYPAAANPPTERRHSLLLERLSMERQLPTADIYHNNSNYQYNTQSNDQQIQWSQEPQAEVVIASNVKPSSINKQQWYQQSNKENVIYNNTAPTTPASLLWSQPSFQNPPQQPPQTQPPPQIQQQAQQQLPKAQLQYQPSYTDSTNTYQQSNYQSYTPKPTWSSSTPSNIEPQPTPVISQPNQYSYLNKTSTDSYQTTKQQYSSSYVPPPWEQDSCYVADNSNQQLYQSPPQTTPLLSNVNQGWKPPTPKNKFCKPPPTAYIPPAPNQSFVKAANSVEQPRLPGKKTYYSEYERRYITVPESTYIPGETKYQPQPDPSPQYYYDNNEPAESVEHEWRKELREFAEKAQTQPTEQSAVRPPWEDESKYPKTPAPAYTPTQTWSQTLRPQSYRERSFESDYVVSQEFPKTNTLGRGRPLSSYGRSNIETIHERTRGVSVDRYNPHSYLSPLPAEHPPVQAHTLNVVPPAKSYHNPSVPAYHAHSRASAEPREQPVTYHQPRQWGVNESRASPVQSRSFKYLQWITGTEH